MANRSSKGKGPLPKILYFDLDGTILEESLGAAKPALRDGVLEHAVREAQFDTLVCVGNAVAIARLHLNHETGVDVFEVMFDICAGAFTNLDWFREKVVLAQDPRNRGAEIDVGADWWYMDDLAERYLERAGRGDLFRQHFNGRILVPAMGGDGRDVLSWLKRITTR